MAGDREITDMDEVRHSAEAHFKDLLAPLHCNFTATPLDGFRHLPMEYDTSQLYRAPSFEEVKEAVFSISGNSTPGPNGFSADFYQKCWSIVGKDVVDAVIQFFEGAYLSRSFTATSIVLIPKKENPICWADYRPISLCNVSNKIITKLIMAQLTPLLPDIIAPNQSGFIQGRLLSDSFLLA